MKRVPVPKGPGGVPVGLKGVPIPERWPIVGHVPHFFGENNGPSDVFGQIGDKIGSKTYLFTVPGETMVVTADADLTKRVMMRQGPESYRKENWSWVRVFKKKDWPIDISNEDGEKWMQYRKVFNKTVANRQRSLEFIPVVEEKSARLVKSINAHIDFERGPVNSEGFYRLKKDTVLRKMFGMTSLEASTQIFLGERAPFLPGVEDESYDKNFVLTPQEGLELADAMELMFTATNDVDNSPLAKIIPDYTPSYQKLDKAWTTAITSTSKMVEKSLAEYDKTGTWPRHVSENSLFPTMLKTEGITRKEAVFLGVEASIAAVDTTAQTSEFLMFNLANSPEAQQKLRAEILENKTRSFILPDVAPGACPFDYRAYDSAHKYLKATIRESMRYTPTVSMHIRTLSEDIHYSPPSAAAPPASRSDTAATTSSPPQPSYFIPKGTEVLMNFKKMARDPEYVSPSGKSKPANEFDPSRFLRKEIGGAGGVSGEEGDRGLDLHAHAAGIPFGVGARKCAGFGLAQIFIETFARDVLSHFEVKYDGPPLVLKDQGLVRAGHDINPHLLLKPVVTK